MREKRSVVLPNHVGTVKRSFFERVGTVKTATSKVCTHEELRVHCLVDCFLIRDPGLEDWATYTSSR